MLRILTCLGLMAVASAAWAQTAGQERREDRRADRQDARAIMHGKIVRYDPAGGVVVVSEGVAPNLREVEYRFEPRVQIYGPDQAAVTTGLRYSGFRPGAEIWFAPGEQEHSIREVRFYDPATQHKHGTVVRFDRDKGIVVIRVGTGPDAKDIEYHVDKDTRFWDPNDAVINNGLGYQGFTQGAEIWFQPVPNATTIRELRF